MTLPGGGKGRPAGRGEGYGQIGTVPVENQGMGHTPPFRWGQSPSGCGVKRKPTDWDVGCGAGRSACMYMWVYCILAMQQRDFSEDAVLVR